MIRPVSISVGIHGLLICLLCIQIGHSYRAIPAAVQRQQPARVVHRSGQNTGRLAHRTDRGRADRAGTRPAQPLAKKQKQEQLPAVPQTSSQRGKKSPSQKKQPAVQQTAAAKQPAAQKQVAKQSVAARGDDTAQQAAPPQPSQNPIAPKPELSPQKLPAHTALVIQEICQSDSQETQGGTEPLDRIRGALAAVWRPPRGIRPTKPCIIRIRMRDGAALSSPVVVQSSGIPAFDMSAQRALLAAPCSHLRGVYEFEFVFAP